MPIGLAALLLLQASDVPEQHLICVADFVDGGRHGHVALLVDRAYTPLTLTLAIHEPDGWSRSEIRLDPVERRFPGLLSHLSFAIRFTAVPALPLTMNAYSDGRLRWRHEIDTPFWPLEPERLNRIVRIGRDAPGIVDTLSRAEDGQPVPTPRELRIVLLDARGRQVGEARYALPGAEDHGPAGTALAAVEAQYRGRTCAEPAPRID